MADELFAAEQEHLRTLPARAPHLANCGASGGSQADHVESHGEESRISAVSAVSSNECSGNVSDNERVPATTSPCCRTRRTPHYAAAVASSNCSRGSCICHLSKNGLDTAATPLSRPGLPLFSAHAQLQEPPTAALDELWEVPEVPEDRVQQLTLHILGDEQSHTAELSGGLLVASGSTAPDEGIQCAIEQVVEMKRHIACLEEDVCGKPEGCDRGKQMVWNMGTMSVGIKAATSQSLGSSEEESRSRAAQQMEHASASLPWAAELAEGRRRLVPSLPMAVPDSFSDEAASVTAHSLQQAPVALSSAPPTSQRPIDSEVAAGVPLHAEAGQAPWTTASALVQSTGTGLANAASAPNIGSRGHPFLCVRPCLFFAQGRCLSGGSCTYCHSVHESKPHLDKNGREMFRRLTFKQRASVALPVLRQMADSQGFGAEAVELLAALEDSARTMPGSGSPSPAVSTAQARQRLLKSLRGLSFRTLLARVCEDAPEGMQCTARNGVARIAESMTP
mmetsp:Transcript_125974/g.350968  ORF Transcript_125974/g.350968 Transcript_125974/m.350968 type:complete len:508 (-) Transcript_125974:253-1776(-)